MNKQESGYRWVVFGTVLFAYFLIVSQRTAPGLITDQLMKDFHVSASTIGLMIGIQFLAYAGLQIPVGLLADRYGPNRFLIIGTLLTGLGSLLYSLAPNEYVLIFSRFLVGTGDAAIFVNLVLILSQWFKAKEFVSLLGVVAMVASLGSLSATVPFSLWISFAGWRLPFLSIGIILVVSAFLLFTVLISRPKRIFKDDSKARKSPIKNRESAWIILRRMFSTRQAWATFLCHFGVVGTYVGFIGSWGVPYGIDVFGLSRSEASQLIMYGLFGAIIGGPLISWITSRLDSIKKIYTLIHLIVLFSWSGLFLAGVKPPFIMIVVLLFIIGFGNGASSLTFAVVRESFPMEQVGVVSGFANMGGFLSAVLLPSVFGNVLDLYPQDSINVGYHYGFIIPVLFSLMGLFGVMLIKEGKKEEQTS
ncbi:MULTISPECIES: MFS transporter [Metabacillus]|uniref:MFS transporter n=1 Tax=Metabacillus hrfriensis TaxID=3048891 RepID=A0ACD4RFS2_9BACI|nr:MULTISPECIES: MFS transporter [Metabacillus]UAL53740.1 MFS transporter [Metabacillus dongyingensis]WHZ59294.1 MFS transporter [Metabacillus sp. CT-WN-B3]